MYQNGKSAVFTTFVGVQRRWSLDNPTSGTKVLDADRLPPLPKIPKEFDIAPVTLLRPHPDPDPELPLLYIPRFGQKVLRTPRSPARPYPIRDHPSRPSLSRSLN